jgi:RHS repeat-associated protein
MSDSIFAETERSIDRELAELGVDAVEVVRTYESAPRDRLHSYRRDVVHGGRLARHRARALRPSGARELNATTAPPPLSMAPHERPCGACIPHKEKVRSATVEGSRNRPRDPNGRAFDEQHQLVELEEPSEGENDRIVWKIEYDTTGQPAWVIDPLGNATHYRYDRHGRLIKVDDPMGRSLDLAWSSRHDLESVTDAEGRVERFGHDALGQMAWSQDPAGRTTRATRDAAGNVTYLERADGERLSMRHDPEGNVVEQIDSQGRRIEMAYFGTGQLRRHVDPMGCEVRFDYDGEEDLTAVVNQAGEKYRFQRDKAGRVRTEIGFDGKRTRLIYDVAGRTERTVGPDYLITYLDRDALGRLTGIRAGTMPGQEETERFGYDARGNLVMTATDEVEIAFERDALGQVVREERRVKEGDRVAIESRYDKSGLRTERETTLGHRASYEWDRAGELRAITMGYASFLKTSALEKLGLPQLGRPDWTMEIIRDRAGEEIVRKMSGGVVAIWKRDAQGRPAERQVLTGVKPGVSPGRDVLHTEYAWTSPEQIGALVDKLTGGQTAFSYDARGHLIRQTLPTGETVHRMSDAVGNLYRTPDMSDARYGPGGVLLSARGTEYKHDGHGNLIEKRLADGAVWKYHWTHTGRLREVERPDGKKVTFAYDPLGRRIEKRFDGDVTEYIWDGDELVHERRRKEGEAPLLTTWVLEPGKAAPVAAQIGSAREGLVDDHLGTPLLAATEAGAIAWSHQLDVYGLPRAATEEGDPTASWRYPGQQADPETGLFYNHFRYYDAESGRYISEDPIGLRGGLGPYNYVHDVLQWVDPLGLTGAYYFIFDTGEEYVGKGPASRFRESMRTRSNQLPGSKIIKSGHLDFGSNKLGFMVEHHLMTKLGFPKPTLLNVKTSPGRDLLRAATADELKEVKRLSRKLERKVKGRCK